MNTPSSKKRKCLKIQQKLEILEELDRGLLSKTEISRKFEIAKSSLSTIIADRDKIVHRRVCMCF